MLGKTKADYRKESEEPAKESLKLRLVLEAVCNDAKVEATDKEVEEKIKELAESYGRKEEELKENSELVEHIKQNVKSEKAIKLIIDNAKMKVAETKKESTKKTAKADDKKVEEEKEEKTTKKSTAKKTAKK